MLDFARTFTSGAVLCPHPEERARQVVYVRDPEGDGPAMGLCYRCRRMFALLFETRPPYTELLATMVAAGYSEEDARQVWSDMQKEDGA